MREREYPETGSTCIYLIRHGETDFNNKGIYQGTLDVPLNEVGRTQAMHLREQLVHISFDAIYSSPLTRAVDTAEAIAKDRALPIVTIDALREISYGHLQGMSISERKREYAELEARWKNDPWNVQFPNGESLESVSSRVCIAINVLLSQHMDETILISAHGHINRLIILLATNGDNASFWEIEQQNGCCYKIDFIHGQSTRISAVTGN